MVWNKALPSNTSKIRNLGIEIRPNWDAIEDGEDTFKPVALNLADRSALVIADDPTAIADTIILYSKQDVGGKPQLFTIDPDDVKTQLTGLPPSYTEGVNGGSAGGTLNKVVRYIDASTRIIEYSGTTNAFTGNKEVDFTENFSKIYTAIATANNGNVQKISVLKGLATLNLYTENSVQVNWYAQGRIT